MSDWNTPLTLTAVTAGSTVQLTKVGSPIVSGLQYRTDSSAAWNSYTIDDVITLANVGDYVQFQNSESNLSSNTSNYVNFVMTGSIGASGNTQSLLNYSESCSSYCFFSLFNGCAVLTAAPTLSATTLADSCYYYMFSGCRALTTTPQLPATTMAANCYRGMFNNCSGLTSAEDLPATTLAVNCYYQMFAGCTSLVTPPALPAVTMETSCYSNMFNGCTSLSSAPELPATTLATSCYDSMFYGCTALLASPQLPALTCAETCYLSMFRNCSSLTTVGTISATTMASQSCMYMFSNCTALTVPPDLLATNLARWCYAYMFEGDTHLIKTPELVATTPEVRCYYHMFYGCSSLSSVKVSFASWVEGSTEDWLSGVASSGVFYKPLAIPEEYGTSRIPEGWQVINTDEIECSPGLPTDIDPLGVTVEEQLPLTLTAVEDSTVTLNAVGSPTTSGLKFRTQSNASWSTYTPGTTIQLPAGKSVQFWNSAETLSLSTVSYAQLTGTGEFSCRGNLQSMLNYISSVPNYAFSYLFRGFPMVNTPEMPADTVGEYGYSSLYRDIPYLTRSERLPALTVKNYAYGNMYAGSGIEHPPVIAATTYLTGSLAGMFSDCGALLSAPHLLATSISRSCLLSAFRNCTHMTSIEVDFTSWGSSDPTTNWVSGVASSGTFVKPSSLPEEYGVNRIPEGWTVINKD